jgi:hypothetical protein
MSRTSTPGSTDFPLSRALHQHEAYAAAGLSRRYKILPDYSGKQPETI